MTLGVVSWGLPELGAAGRVRCHIIPAAVSTLRTWEEAGTPTQPFSLQPHPGAILYRELLKGLVFVCFRFVIGGGDG